MQKDTVIQAIHQVLEQQLNCLQLHAFSESARLNQDLYLDSVLVLQLLLGLEADLGIEIPDTELTKEDAESVSSLADFIRRHCAPSNDTTPDTATQTTSAVKTAEQDPAASEEFEDIKVHCFVSCVCEAIKAHDNVDHRPFYFGVWDAEVVVDTNYSLNYHSDSISHDFFRQWYQRLYGVEVVQWYRPQLSKADNINGLLKLLDSKTPDQNIMVMVDMFRLPERENKFNQNPFPHYVMLEKTPDPDTWFMFDPDFRWEGTQSRQQVLDSISSDAVGGGYIFSNKDITPTADEAIFEYFHACFNPTHNPMTDKVSEVVAAHLQGLAPLSKLGKALNHLPVLAIRKYAYEHGLAYFWHALDMDFDEFERWCDVIESLVSSYKQIQYRAMKLAQKNHSDLRLQKEIDDIIAQQNQREFSIKARLQEVFNHWCKIKNFTPTLSMVPLESHPLTNQPLTTAEPA